jgi:hypothetical protein
MSGDRIDPPHDLAFHGLAGNIVRTIEPHSEADPAALLVQTLTEFGNVIGRTAYFEVEARRHYANIYAALVGESSKARKGSSFAQIEAIFKPVDAVWTDTHVEKGLSSGEGLIWAVRDPITKVLDGEEKTVDEGVQDKRILIVEEELASPLKMMTREGNILSIVIRSAWDTGKLRTLTKNSPARATDAHISLIGHTTADELRRHLGVTEMANGFANRFLWIFVSRSKFLPEGGQMHKVDVAPIVRQLGKAVSFAKAQGLVDFDQETRRLWQDVYEQLSTPPAGMLGALTARSEAQTRRLAMVYALMDCSPVVHLEHLVAGLALWDYAYRSTEAIFGDSLGDPTADEILRALRGRSLGMTRTEIRDFFGRHKGKDEIGRGLGVLLDRGLADYETEKTDGRPAERWVAIATKATHATEAPGNPFGAVLRSLPAPMSQPPTDDYLLVIGDDMYPSLLAHAVRDGYIAEAEAEERNALHRIVVDIEAGAGGGFNDADAEANVPFGDALADEEDLPFP